MGNCSGNSDMRGDEVGGMGNHGIVGRARLQYLVPAIVVMQMFLMKPQVQIFM